MTITVRASRTPLLYKCAGSAYLESLLPKEDDSDAEPDPDNAAASGTIAHRALAAMVSGNSAEIDSLPEHVRKPVINGIAMWKRGDPDGDLRPLQDYFGGCSKLFVEHAMAGDEMGKGTMDVGGWREHDRTLVVLDWKTGFLKRDYLVQLLRYGARLAFELGVEPAQYLLLTVYPRVWDWTAVVLTPEEVDEVFAALEENHAVSLKLEEEGLPEGDLSAFTTGTHCTLCRALLPCPAKTAVVRRFAGVQLPPVLPSDLQPMAHGDIANAYAAARWMENAAELLRDRIREMVKSGGPVDMGDGTMLAVREVEGKTTVDTESALLALPRLLGPDGEKVFGPEQIARVFTGKAGEIEKIVKATVEGGAGKGKTTKKQAWADAEALLRKCGALKDGEPTERMEPVAKEKLLKGEPE